MWHRGTCSERLLGLPAGAAALLPFRWPLVGRPNRPPWTCRSMAMLAVAVLLFLATVPPANAQYTSDSEANRRVANKIEDCRKTQCDQL